MQVSTVADRVTHAVIGGREAQSLQINDEDGSLFAILSDALYSDKQLAVVREVLCNAWDAHVEAGCTDTPVQVTLDNTRLIIRDFGTGIPDHKIVDVYGTYGKSTKKDNVLVTGGFGLGSKSPWAYVDHFEVISHCEGTKAIYKMSKSSAAVNGKPNIALIVAVPTQETGLAVSINLNEPRDRDRFEELVNTIASFGEMNVELNGRKVETVPFRIAQHGFLIVKKQVLFNTSAAGRSVAIRYGHVLYPLETADAFSTQYEQVEKFLKFASNNSSYYAQPSDWALILQAPADSIAITPAREAISMTTQTIKTVTGLLDDFLNHQNGKLEEVCIEFNKDAINKTWLVGSPQQLLRKEKSIPNIHLVPHIDPKYIGDFDTLGHYYMKQQYPKMRDFRKQDIIQRLDALIESGFGKRGLVLGFKQALMQSGSSYDSASDWFHKKYAASILKGMIGNKDLDPEKLMVYAKATKRRGYGEELTFTPITKFGKKSWESYLPFLRGVIAISHNRTDVDRVRSFPVMRHWLGDSEDILYYVVPRSPAKLEAARSYFKNLGLTIVDLTVRQAWEPKEVVVKNPADRKPRKKGLPTLSSVIDSYGQIDVELLKAEDVTRTENPEFIFKVAPRSGDRIHKNRCHQWNVLAVKLFGSKGGVVVNTTQETKFMERGITQFEPYMHKKILDEYKTNPLIKQHYEQVGSMRQDISYSAQAIYEAVRRDEILRKEYGFPDPVTQNELDYIALFDTYDRWDRSNIDELKEIQALIDTWKFNPTADALMNTISDSTSIGIINGDVLKRIFSNSVYTDPQKETAREILRLALKG